MHPKISQAARREEIDPELLQEGPAMKELPGWGWGAGSMADFSGIFFWDPTFEESQRDLIHWGLHLGTSLISVDAKIEAVDVPTLKAWKHQY